MPVTSSMMTISLEDVMFHAFHGVFSQETSVGNEFSLSLSVHTPVTSQMEDDNLDGTVSYADLYEICRDEMNKTSKLIEHVAIRIAREIKKNFPQVHSGMIRISKLHPPIAGFDGAASVEIRF